MKLKAQPFGVKRGYFAQHESTETPKQVADAIQGSLRFRVRILEARVNIFVEVVKQRLACILHPFFNLRTKLVLELFECGVNRFGGSAIPVDGENPFLEVDARLDRPQHFVGSPKQAAE